MDVRLETWFGDQRAVSAPDGVLRSVAERTRSTRQRPGGRGLMAVLRGLAGARPRPMPAIGLGLAAVVGILVASAVLRSPTGQPDGRPGVVGGPSAPSSTPAETPSPSSTPAPAPTPTLAPGAIRIDFQVSGGIYCMMQAILYGCDAMRPVPTTPALPPGHLVSHGTFTMTGAFTDTGSFSDAISFTTAGVFTVTRTLETTSGRLDAVSTVTTLTNATNSMTTSGTWRFVGGTGPWTTVGASGTLSGASAPAPSETWIGTVTP